MSRKVFFVALDGAADRPLSALNGKTPLSAAHTRYLDQMAQAGQMSLISILSQNITPESDSGAMALLGYPPEHYYCGRGTLECMGLETYRQYRYFAGFRINFASMDYARGILDRRTARGLSEAELQALTEEICDGVTLYKWGDIHFELKSFGNFRGILGLYSNTIPLSGNVSNTDPGYVKEGRFSIPSKVSAPHPLCCVPLDQTESARITAAIINDFSLQCESILQNAPVNALRRQRMEMEANCILVRDGGSIPASMPDFHTSYGASLSIYGQLPCEKAIAAMIGGTFQYSQAFDLQLNEHYLRCLAKQLKADSADVVFCHLKGPDEPGHDNRPFDKVAAIELIDRCFFSELWDAESEYTYIVTCDHATPCEAGIHTADPVPLLIVGGFYVPDSTTHFDEAQAAIGHCPVKYAVDILKYIFTGSSYV